MRTSYGYDTYRGRTRLQSALTVLIVILLVVLLLAVAAFFFLQKYMVYTDDGQARLELPFLQQATPEPVPTQNQPLVIVTPEPAVTATAEPDPTPAPVPEVAPVSLFRAAVTQGNAQQLVTAAGGNAALLNMKANDGSLGYVSSLPLAISSGASAAEPGLNEKLLGITGSNVYTIARISCFKDNLAPKTDGTLAIKTSGGYNWRDGEEKRWMNPALPEAREYVAGICMELADMGFDEILLDNGSWPTTGRLDSIRPEQGYDPAGLTEAVESLYREVREALKEKDVLLSVSVEAKELNGTSALSGQSAALIGEYADRVYVLGAEREGECDAVLKQAGLSGGRVIYVEKTAADLSTTGKPVAENWTEAE